MDFALLKEHHNHEIVCVVYGDVDSPANIAIECETCHCVLFDLCPGDYYAKILAGDAEERHPAEDALQNLLDRNLISDPDGDHMDEVRAALQRE